MIKLDTYAGYHISAVCNKASETAKEANEPVEFEFNGITVIAQPGESADTLQTRRDHDFTVAAEAYRESDEYRENEARRAAEWKQKTEAILEEKAVTEEELRETKSPWPYTPKQLAEYIDSSSSQDPQLRNLRLCYEPSSTAAFNYAAHVVGSSSFQASCADLDFIKRSRHIEGPFILLKGEDMLYPQ